MLLFSLPVVLLVVGVLILTGVIVLPVVVGWILVVFGAVALVSGRYYQSRL